MLLITVELATTKVHIQGVPTLLRMKPNQNPIVGKRGVAWVHQEHQRFIAIWITFDLIWLEDGTKE